MSNKTINEALKDVFLNLGGNPSDLSDNSTVSDYIEDLGSAIEAEVSSAVSEVKQLPEVTEANNGQVLAVSGGEWKLCTMTANANLETGAVTFTLTPVVAET